MKAESKVPVIDYQRAHPLITDPGESRLLPHMPQLDGIRAIAVLLVVFHHFQPKSAMVPTGPSWGAIGVGLFFCLSGFLITRILLNCRLKIEAREASLGQMLKQFYVRRALRIFPLYYAVLAVLAVFNVTGVRDRIGWHVAYLSNYRFAMWPRLRWDETQAERHLWSLSVEEQFYVFWPIIILLAPRKLLLPLMVLVIAVGPVYRWNAYEIGFMAHEWMTFACLDLLGVGALLGLLSIPQYGLSRYFHGFVETVGLIGVPLFFIWLAQKLVITPTTIHPKRLVMQYHNHGFDWQGGATYFVTALLAAWLIGTAARGFKGPFGYLLQSPPMVFVGRISYGLYVLHMFVPHFFIHVAPSLGFGKKLDWPFFFLCTAVSFALATVSWFAFEKPINGLKRYFEYEKPRAKSE